jgi:hypothetical protein
MPDREGTTRGAEETPRPKPRPVRSSPRPPSAEEARAVRSGNKSKQRIESEGTPKFRDGGMVRGCKSGQMSGKGFSGTY